MSIRKIPMKKQPSFQQGEDTSEDESEDPEVTVVLETIRRHILTDRALYDKVWSTSLLQTPSIDEAPSGR